MQQKQHKKTNTQGSKGKNALKMAKNVMRHIYHSVMATITFLFCLVFLFSAFSDYVNPQWFVYPSFLGISFGIQIVLMLGWLVVLLCLKRWRCVLMVIIALLLTSGPIVRYCPLHIFGSPSPTRHVTDSNGQKHDISIDSIRLITYNTCALGRVHLSKVKEEIPVIEYVQNSGADIVCMQEYAFTLSKGGHTQEQLRNTLSKEYPYYDFTPNDQRTAMGIALFTKYPIRKATRVDKRKKDYFSCMYYQLEVKGRRVGLINMHLHTNSIQPADRIFYEEMIDHFEPDSIGRIRSGLLRALNKAFRQRADESRQIVQFLNENHPADMPLIICGDMNDTPISYCYHTIRQELTDTWREAGLGCGTTYNEHRFLFRIDHIFHSSHLKALDIRVRKDIPYSDHYPVEATLQLLPQP